MSRRVRRRSQRRSAGRAARKALQLVTAAATLLGSYAYSQDAEAAVPKELRKGTRAAYFLGGVGGDWHLYHRYYYNDPRVYRYSRLRLHQEFGGHFSGDSSGPALALVTQQGFPNYGRYWNGYTGGDFSFQVKGKFLWDIQPKKGLAFYISPFATVGWAGWFGNAYWYRTYGYRHSATTSIGVQGKLIIWDRLVAFVQVPTFEFFFNQYDWYARFSFFTGVGVTFG